MKRIVAIVITALSVTLTGCLNGRSGPGQLTRSHLQFEKTKDVESLDLDSHKDVEVESVERIAPDGSTVKIKGYRSRANEAAIVNATKQAESAAKVAESNVEMLKIFGGYALQWASGGTARPQQQVIVVTNYVTVPATNAPAK